MADMTYKDLVWTFDDYDGEFSASVRFQNSWEVEVIESENKPTDVLLKGVLPEGYVCHHDLIYEGNLDRDIDILAINLIFRIVPCLPPYTPPSSFSEFNEPIEDL